MRNHPIEQSEQNILNEAKEKDFNAITVISGEYDGVNLQHPQSSNLALKVVESGSYTYVCVAPTGTSQATALWQCKKVDESVAGTTVVTWADGDAEFNNVATDPTALTYS